MVKFMKKIVKSFLLMLLVFNLVSCSESSSQSATNNTEKSTEEAKVEEVKGFTDGTVYHPYGRWRLSIYDVPKHFLGIINIIVL